MTQQTPMSQPTALEQASAAGAQPVAVLDLAVQGMTCASCVARVERKVGKIAGATALVNLATESARVELTAGHGRRDDPPGDRGGRVLGHRDA